MKDGRGKIIQKGGVAGNSGIDALTCELRRWNRVWPRNINGCNSEPPEHSEQSAVVDMALPDARRHEVFCSPRPRHLSADLLTAKRLTERVLPR